MDNTTDRETRDFMNVDSFSQLPFIRPHKAAGAIRLFGKDFGTDDQSDSNEGDQQSKEGSSGDISSRKFECHYCCRNFPTSQALGGHQNAHKRERQQAKRAHLQSAMVHGGLSDAHIYGLINYTRPPLPMAYHSWNSSSRGLYGSYQPQPINGSPLALWRAGHTHTSTVYARERAPHVHQDESHRLSSIPTSQFRFGYESKPEVHDHVSLDLHL